MSTYGLYNHQMYDSERGTKSAPGSGYISASRYGGGLGNWWSGYAIDRARKYALTGNSDYLYKSDYGDPAEKLIMVMGGMKEWRKKAQKMRADGIEYFNEQVLEEIRKHNQSLSPKVKVKKP